MSETGQKVGIISCSGEAIAEGTLSRLATRRVLEALRPDSTVTICLPLFLAGNDAERDFARTHPTIAVDGCAKQCAKWGTEQHSGPVSEAIVISDLLGTECEGCHRSSRERSQPDREAVWMVAERIAAAVDTVLAETRPAGTPATTGAACACSGPMTGGTIIVNDTAVTITGLPLMLGQCLERGVPLDAGTAVLEVVKIYHPIAREDEPAYAAALLEAYRQYCGAQ